MELLQAFGVNWKTVLSQLVNFLILMFLLYLIGYKPMLKFMKDRTSKIEKGVADAEEAKKILANAEAKQEEILVKARKEASDVIEKSRTQAKEQGTAIVEKAKSEVQAVVLQGKEVIKQERTKMLEEVKADVIDMVIASTKKVLAGAVDKDVDQKWLKDQLKK